MLEKKITLLATPDMRLLMGAQFDHPGNVKKTFWTDFLSQASTTGNKRRILFDWHTDHSEIYSCYKLNNKEKSLLIKKIKAANEVVIIENDSSKYTPRFKEHEEVVQPRNQPTTIVDFINNSPKLTYLDIIPQKKG